MRTRTLRPPSLGMAPLGIGAGFDILTYRTAGAVVSALVPCNAGGAIVITALGLGVADSNFENPRYIPLSFACWMSPVIGIVYACFGWFSPKARAAEKQRWHDMNEPIQIIEPSSGASLRPGFAAS